MDETKMNGYEGVLIVVAQDRVEESVVASAFAPIGKAPREAEAWFREKHDKGLGAWSAASVRDAELLGEAPNASDRAEPFVRAVVLPAEVAFRILVGGVDAYEAGRLVTKHAGTVAEHWLLRASPSEYAAELRSHLGYRGVGGMTARLMEALAGRLDTLTAWPGGEPRNMVCVEHAKVVWVVCRGD